VERCLACEAVVSREYHYIYFTIVCAMYRTNWPLARHPILEKELPNLRPLLNRLTIDHSTAKAFYDDVALFTTASQARQRSTAPHLFPYEHEDDLIMPHGSK
jgi:hypothetical protein